jgi:hypothetical protein
VGDPARRPQALAPRSLPSHAPHMSADPAPLYAIAAELDRRAALLRARAWLIGTAPTRTRWSSAGARAWADGVARIRMLLLRSAEQVEHAAVQLRARAAEVCSWE